MVAGGCYGASGASMSTMPLAATRGSPRLANEVALSASSLIAGSSEMISPVLSKRFQQRQWGHLNDAGFRGLWFKGVRQKKQVGGGAGL